MSQETCQHPDGCPKSPYSSAGWCEMHWKRIQRKGDPGPVGSLKGQPTTGNCQHPDGCPNPVKAKGWCDLHLGRIYQKGDPGPVGKLIKDKRGLCQHPDGCRRPESDMGYCSMHAARLRRTGELGPRNRIHKERKWSNKAKWGIVEAIHAPAYKPGQLCLECQEAPVHARFLCKRCYQRYRWRAVKNPDTFTGWPTPYLKGPNKRKRCHYCDRRARVRGYCRMHYNKLLIRGLISR